MGSHTTKPGKQSRAQTRPPLPYPVNDGRIAPAVQEAMDRRAHRRKSRLAAISAASMLAVGGAAGVSIATADEQESGSSSEVVFSGDCGTLGVVSATSYPDATELTVDQGSQVRYSNDLGTDAKLHVGDEVYEIGPGSSQVFEMNRSAEVAMVPNCHGLFAEYESAQVRVVEAQADGSQSGEDESGGDVELPPAGGDEGGDAEDDSQDEGAGVADDGAEAPQGEEAEDPAAAVEEPAVDEEVNAFGLPPSEDSGAGGDAPAVEDEVVAVDPAAVADGANGLLALLAIICLVGVAAAVARTLLKQRATA
ncbi:hypothetical protein [Glycomyces algeriensis]|uniref:Uncharacterized protein n=1 Tax=Glycomyces algeriensis TaxID=256037 RepID=A0A9W6G4R1_9ACTN|nr:hypothetical protein [Glycomyces algeriensis]MDA1368938.1 hypothetical protein [Glycomyces algeriensis]MDR7353319.1 hypothetical protein [Glycomyces algeriensis]GLI41015.1 hypothetical protein GALLR39Z86_08650 [Glycomyces algeriensis]